MEAWSIVASFSLVFVTFILVLVTTALVVVTWMYVAHTKRMADFIVKDYEIKINPLIDISLSQILGDSENFERDIKIHNVGQNRVYLKNARCDIVSEFGDFESKNIFLEKDMLELSPGEQKSYNVKLTSSDIPPVPTKPGVYYFARHFDIVFSLNFAGPNQDFKNVTKKLI